jgi:undecaprenyl-diphosphatase
MGERRTLSLYHAIALGLLHGPTELLPVSSSGHTTLLPWFAGWPYGELEPQSRKSFEVALHAGTATALLLYPPSGNRPKQPASALHALPPQTFGAKFRFGLAATLPPAIVGYVFGAPIERRLGTPATIARGLYAGSAAILVGELHAHSADRQATLARAARESGSPAKNPLGAFDGLALGVAQALALMPGVSRHGATYAVARTLGCSRGDADRLSWRVGLPIIAGAALLKGARLAGEGIPRTLRLPLALGTTSAFLSTLASTKIIKPERRAALLPACLVYRTALALLVIRRMRDNTS